MLENPTTNLNVLGYCCAKIRFKQLYLSNHSELITCTYELPFLTKTYTITSHNTELHPISPCIYVYCTEKYSINNSVASSVFIIHVSIAISYHSSHNVLFTFVMNIMYLLNYINHPNFSILVASNNCIKVNVKFSLYKPWRYTGRVEVQQKLTMSGATPPLPILMACTGWLYVYLNSGFKTLQLNCKE
jgi:hypothetical protein